MHALSKKHYYDVIKSGQEDTILESDQSKVNCERVDTPTSEVGCYARPHVRSNAVQTHWSRNNKNFCNKYTFTSDADSGEITLAPLGSPNLKAQSSIHCSRSYEDIAIIRKRSFQATSENNHQNLLLQSVIAPKILVERAVGHVQCFEMKQKRCPLASKATETENLVDDKCIQCTPKMSICDMYQYIPSKRGLAACRTFTLGAPESRRLQSEQCETKLIGGCRVPVCKDYKSRF